jgi:acyl-CoA thioester hydrolase
MKAVDTVVRRRFVLPVRVYYEDTDAAGVVYYANYLRYLERARTEWLRTVGFDQSTLTTERGIAFAVRSLDIEYLRPARLDDLLDIACAIDSLGGARLVFEQRVERNGETLVTASVSVVCIDVARLKAVAIPNDLRSQIEALI